MLERFQINDINFNPKKLKHAEQSKHKVNSRKK